MSVQGFLEENIAKYFNKTSGKDANHHLVHKDPLIWLNTIQGDNTGRDRKSQRAAKQAGCKDLQSCISAAFSSLGYYLQMLPMTAASLSSGSPGALPWSSRCRAVPQHSQQKHSRNDVNVKKNTGF